MQLLGAQMDPFDFVIIGAGAGGEAAAHEARRLGASVAIVDRELFGGSCPFWASIIGSPPWISDSLRRLPDWSGSP
jgi:flavin-dependent dehydrogenase